MPPPSAANDVFDLTARETHIAEREIAELPERADVTPQPPLSRQSASQLDAAAGESADPLCELARDTAGERVDGLALLAPRTAVQFIRGRPRHRGFEFEHVTLQ
jgi:hypothetical protein